MATIEITIDDLYDIMQAHDNCGGEGLGPDLTTLMVKMRDALGAIEMPQEIRTNLEIHIINDVKSWIEAGRDPQGLLFSASVFVNNVYYVLRDRYENGSYHHERADGDPIYVTTLS